MEKTAEQAPRLFALRAGHERHVAEKRARLKRCQVRPGKIAYRVGGVAARLAQDGLRVVRFEFPYMAEDVPV